MASTSKYIQLTHQILVEYIYTDTISPEVIETNTGGARVMLLDNPYTNSTFLFNEDAPNVITGNYRTRSAIPVNSERTKYAYLTNNSALNYLDFDNNLANVSDLLGQLTAAPNIPNQLAQYDTIRVHLISGFVFDESSDGFVFEVQFKDKQYRKHNLASIVYLRTDSYETLNPKPFIVGERLYSKYIELKVPALSWLTTTYQSSPVDTTTLPNQITDNIGLLTQNTIDLSVKSINKSELINGQKYFTLGNESNAALNKTDEYSLLSATIVESPIGDFFELFGEYNGNIYEDFIFELEAQPNTDITVIHEVRLYEQINDTFIQTSEHNFVQTGDFGTPYLFRPIIVNSHVATSYRIDYTLRIYNKFDNTQIIRISNFSSFDVKKYGRRIRKLNLGTLPIVTKVYNTLSNDNPIVNIQNVSIDSTGTKVITKSEFVVSFRERLKVSASVTSVQTGSAPLEEGDIVPTNVGGKSKLGLIPLDIKNVTPTDKIWPQNQAPLSLSMFDNFVLFVLYDNSVKEATGAKHPQFLDLTNVGNIYLTFHNKNTGEELRLLNYTNVKSLSPAQGEVVFKISKQDAKKIMKYPNNDFYLSSVLEVGAENSDETLMYSGKWYAADTKFDTIYADNIIDLQTQVNSLALELDAEQTASADVIGQLNQQLIAATSLNNALEDKMAVLDPVALQQIKMNNKLTSDPQTVKDNAVKGTLAANSNTGFSTGPKTILTDQQQLILDKINKGEENSLSQHQFNKTKGISSKNFKL